MGGGAERQCKCKYKAVISGITKLSTTGRRQELPWWPSGEDSVLPLQRVLVQSLARELRSHMPSCFNQREKKEHCC